MVSATIWQGHKVALIAQFVIATLLLGILSGVTSVAVNAADKSNELKVNSNISTDLIQRINTLDGISTYSFLVLSITIVVALLMQAAIVQFMIADAKKTVGSLRVLGVSALRVVSTFVMFAVMAVILAFFISFLLSPVIQSSQIWLLSRIGLDVSDVGVAALPSISGIIAFVLALFSCLVVLQQARSLTRLGNESTNHRAISKVRVALQVVAFGVLVFSLVTILSHQTTIENLNGSAFGAMFATILALACIMPILLVLLAKVLQKWGATGLSVGGVISGFSGRISAIALISALLLSVGGTSAMLTLASSSAGKYMAMNSISADALTTEIVETDTPTVDVSPFVSDNGWILNAPSLQQMPVIQFNPDHLAPMLSDATIESGDLQAVADNKVVASATRYEIGDRITLTNDFGETRELEVVALASANSIFGSAVGVNIQQFSASDPENLYARSYAVAPGGIDAIKQALPQYEWQTLEQYVTADLETVQSSQTESIISMIGGISFVAILGFLYSVVGFAVNRRDVNRSLQKLGMQQKTRKLVFGWVGLAIALVAGAFTYFGIRAAMSQVQEVLDSLGVTYPLDVPWVFLFLMWLGTGIVAVLGMILGASHSRSRHR